MKARWLNAPLSRLVQNKISVFPKILQQPIFEGGTGHVCERKWLSTLSSWRLILSPSLVRRHSWVENSSVAKTYYPWFAASCGTAHAMPPSPSLAMILFIPWDNKLLYFCQNLQKCLSTMKIRIDIPLASLSQLKEQIEQLCE